MGRNHGNSGNHNLPSTRSGVLSNDVNEKTFGVAGKPFYQ